jgi:hypothetical protein
MVVATLVRPPRLPKSLPTRLPVKLQKPAQPRRVEPGHRTNVPDHGATKGKTARSQGPAGHGGQEKLQFPGCHRERRDCRLALQVETPGYETRVYFDTLAMLIHTIDKEFRVRFAPQRK